MGSYWIRHRLFISLILILALSVVMGALFVFPYIALKADTYNDQSIYRNSEMDFVVPEPSYDQVEEMRGYNSISAIFPYFLTKTQVKVNGVSRETTLLLSDNDNDLDNTMYNQNRLIEESQEDYECPIMVDWQFCHDTSSGLGDEVSITIAGETYTFQISSIYETNTLYDGGAIIALVDDSLINTIKINSQSNGYSGMYVTASDYSACKTFLLNDYRPLGRLRDRESFNDEEQYQIHYNAIMASSYANEITDFRVRESDIEVKDNSWLIWVGTVLTAVLLVAFNMVMIRRGCEQGYFKKHCIPKGVDVNPYYRISFIFELILFIVSYLATLITRWFMYESYIPQMVIDYKLLIVPSVVIIVEVIIMIINKTMISGMIRRFKEEEKKKEEEAARQASNAGENTQLGC